MKTAVTVIECVQTGYDSFADIKHTKVFDDSSTLGDIKAWVKSILKLKGDVWLSSCTISDIND
jgi:hypothetical protein